jgi:inosose dehydratase
MLKREHIKIAAQPINWINDDFKDLGADTSLDQCLSEMREAGFEGSELGHRFADDGDAIRAQLSKHNLVLASGWHSTYLASKSFEEELASFDRHAHKLKTAGADVVILAECTGAIHGDGRAQLSWPDAGVGARAQLSRTQLTSVLEGLERLAIRAKALGMKTAYHHHMGTVFQDAGDVDVLLANTSELGLVFDTGHLTFAGHNARVEIERQLERRAHRIKHVHLKNVRPAIAQQARAERWSFERAVRAGVFTVPGDAQGCVDFDGVLRALGTVAYQGWLVVEAEQDPHKANPLAYAKKARAYLREQLGF